MKGSIRIFVGFMVIYGAVGTLDFDPDASVVTALILSIIGAIIMASGVNAQRSVK